MPGQEGNRPNDGSAEDESGNSREDSDFEDALEVFDGQILSQREAIRARRNETAGQGTRPEPEEPKPSGGSEEEEAPGGGGGDVEGESAPASKPPPRLPVPPDVADATDDDVVCRQIREAAIAETDEELREALWDEYRRCGGRR